MIYGISGTALPSHLVYAPNIQRACVSANFPPCLAYAIAWRETISGQLGQQWNAQNIVSPDKGYGLFQLTSPFMQPWPPSNWTSPDANTNYALTYFLNPALHFFAGRGLRGDDLVRCVAAAFNEGTGTAWLEHLAGDVDLGTTGHDYASSVLSNYHRLIAGQDPV